MNRKLSKRTIWRLTIAIALVATTAVAAGAGRRHVDVFVEGSDDQEPEAVAVADFDGSFTASEKADAERLGALEAEFTAANQPGALYQRATAEGSPSTEAMSLSDALLSAGQSRLDNMRVTFVEADKQAGVVYESISFGDGSQTGYIRVWWQTLLGDEPSDAWIGEFGVVSDQGPYDLIVDTREEFDPDFRLVRLYDGAKILSLMSDDIPGIEVDELISIAKRVFGSLPDSG